MEMKRVCPYCLFELPAGQTNCRHCVRALDFGDWPPIVGADNLAPWTTENLVPPDHDGEPYSLPPLAPQTVRGRVLSALPYAFGVGKSCVRIGGSMRLADICIDGASPLHAALLLNRRTRSWWAFDCGASGGVFVNGQRVRLRELQDDDVMEIAGVRLAFRGDRIESCTHTVGGIALTVKDLLFELPGRDHPILDHVSFSVAPGEFIGILGPSGCGKSSLVQRIVGLSSDYRGQILVNGNDRREVESEFRAATAYLPQNVDETLHPSLTLGDEIDCFRRINLAEAASAAEEERENGKCLRTLGLAHKKLSDRVGDMSGGEKRRVGIALALMRKPRLLLLDEPGAGLDPASEATLMTHLREVADQGRTVLCITHVLANAGKFSKLLVFSRGKVVYFGPPAGLLAAFGVDDFGRLYQLLDEGVKPTAVVPDGVMDASRCAMPETDAGPGAIRIIGGYLRRAFRQFNAIQPRGGKKVGLLARLSSMPMTFFLWQPLGLVFGLRIACAYYFRENGGRAVAVDMLGFCASLSMFWIGINNSAREFVKERVPGRCLERLNQVPFLPYALSKILWTLLICAAQTLSFTVLLCLASRLPVPLVAVADGASLELTSLWFFPLYLTCLMGAACGLAVSAIAKNQLGAISVVPNVAILALLFSNAVVQFEQNEYHTAVAGFISRYLMPCHWPSKVLEGLQCGGCSFAEWGTMFLVGAVYCLLSAVIIWFYQRRNETAWEGR